jgi:pimeloyl-ACP methyl ester carboxylesterase
VLTIVTTYWVTRTAGSAARFYAETARSLAASAPTLTVPTGCAVFPGDIVRPSRRWAARVHPNIVHWTEMPRGGHFGAFEVPDLLVDDLRAFFRPLREGGTVRAAAGR